MGKGAGLGMVGDILRMPRDIGTQEKQWLTNHGITLPSQSISVHLRNGRRRAYISYSDTDQHHGPSFTQAEVPPENRNRK